MGHDAVVASHINKKNVSVNFSTTTTKKAYINIKSIINKGYNYAIRKEIIVKHSKDMFKSLEIPKNEFKTTEKKPCQLSFYREEVAVLRKYKYRITPQSFYA